MPAHTDLPVISPRVKTTASPPVNDPLQPYVPTTDKPWNARRVVHLYRRLGFDASLAQIQQALQMTPVALVDQLLDTAAGLGPPDPTPWANWSAADYGGNTTLIFQHIRELKRRWMIDFATEGIRSKMAFFWHDHFVTQLSGYMCNSWLWDYYSSLHEFAYGNFKTFALKIGKSPAMLHYLNGNLNVVGEPNENYARELMELFTMGESNGYTQLDVVEMSRALTGWKASFNDCTAPFFDPAKFDDAPKTIFGVTDTFDFTSAHLLIFQERPMQVSQFITAKIYRNYVYQTVDPQIIEGLATTFRDNNWELLPVLRQLFKSEHFFEARFLNARLKSPLEALIPVLKMAGAKSSDHILPAWWDDIAFFSGRLGQIIFDPPNVAGWPGNRAWINESTLASRWNYAALVANFLSKNDQLGENLRAIAQTLTNDSKDPVLITGALVDFFTGQTLDPIYLDAATGYFKSGIPEGYFTDGSWNLSWDEVPGQIINLLKYLFKLPEYQLS